MTITEKKALAKRLYLHTNASIKSIAEQALTTEKSLRDWVKKFGWELEKSSKTITPEKLLQEAYAQLSNINQTITDEHKGVPNKQLSDAKAVLIKEIETLSNYPLHRYISVMDAFTVWLSKNAPKNLRDTVELMNRFVESMATKEGVA